MLMLNILHRLAVIVPTVPITIVPVPQILWQLRHILPDSNIMQDISGNNDHLGGGQMAPHLPEDGETLLPDTINIFTHNSSQAREPN
jgi:hypothetical protein